MHTKLLQLKVGWPPTRTQRAPHDTHGHVCDFHSRSHRRKRQGVGPALVHFVTGSKRRLSAESIVNLCLAMGMIRSESAAGRRVAVLLLGLMGGAAAASDAVALLSSNDFNPDDTE